MICGPNAVRGVLEGRPETIHRLVVERGRDDGRVSELVELATAAGVPVSREPRAALDRLSEGENHQGVVAVEAATTFADLGEVVDQALDDRSDPLLVALDGITDPHNLGAIARTAECVAAAALIVPRHRSAAPAAGAHRASAGALGRLPLCRVTNLAKALDGLKERGFWVVGTAAEGGSAPWEIDLAGPLVVVVGSEESGMRPGVARRCDFIATVPTPGDTESLNASVATGMVLYEALRQRSGR
jgi:23S rRNA (guanosine2251-2'-O)-methyltransferase